MPIAETNRLLISKITLKDAKFFLELVNSPHWLKYIGDRHLKTVKDSKTYLQNGTIKSYADFGFGFYKLQYKKEGNKPIGVCGLIKRKQLDDVDIGFALLPEYEGKGFGHEASVTILKLAKETFNLKKVVAITQPNNTSSIKLLEKLGLSFEKSVKPFEDGEELLLFAKTL
ncbi:MAG TPA: GNAT family N-acetyltransferase [Flavobacteriaceae bacterium]|jgi:RimJ/RimL family protein N-acetyltransferase